MPRLTFTENDRFVDAIAALHSPDITDFRSILLLVAKNNPKVFIDAMERRKAEDPKMYKVVLVRCGPNKIQCIKMLRDILGLSLANAKTFSEVGNRTVARGVSEAAATQTVKKLKDTGALAMILTSDNVMDQEVDSYGNILPSF
jgi:ribosomal protein L7/L12